MDTRYWGPPGWRMLHYIAAGPNAAKNRTFWLTLPYVLPCKFCRASLSEYYEKHPVPTDTKKFPEWLWIIHNCVNGKLRSQGQNVDPDPPFEAVQERYTELLALGCTKTEFYGWEFLFCIADNHPDVAPSVPMPDVPTPKPKGLAERNRYNLLTSQERKTQLKRFWTTLPDVLPFQEWVISWRKHAGPLKNAVATRASAKAWLWKIRCGMERDLQFSKTCSFHGLCKKLRTYRSGCSTSRNARTCRRIRPSRGSKTRKH
jgi:hypothetical protein